MIFCYNKFDCTIFHNLSLFLRLWPPPHRFVHRQSRPVWRWCRGVAKCARCALYRSASTSLAMAVVVSASLSYFCFVYDVMTNFAVTGDELTGALGPLCPIRHRTKKKLKHSQKQRDRELEAQ